MLWFVELVYRCGGKEEHFVWSVKLFSLPFPPLYFQFSCQFDRCLSFQGCGGSWLGCHVLLAIGAVSILELAASSGSSRMFQASKVHIATQLLNLRC